MNIKMQVYGGEELVRRLNAMPDGMSKRVVHGALKKAGEPMRARAASLAPRGPEAPHLADNIRISIVTDRNVSGGGRDPERDFAIKIGPTRDVFYGFFQEYGTARHGARPFLRPAFDTTAPASLAEIGRQLWDAIRKQAGTGGTQPSTVGGRFL